MTKLQKGLLVLWAFVLAAWLMSVAELGRAQWRARAAINVVAANNDARRVDRAAVDAMFAAVQETHPPLMRVLGLLVAAVVVGSVATRAR